MNRVHLLCVVAMSLLGCEEQPRPSEAPPESSSSDIAERITAAQEELRRVEEQIEVKRQEAKLLACKSDVEDLRAEVSLERAACMYELAEQAKCNAEVERDKGDSSLFGCTLGIVGALASGGSATPWALSGCVAGRAAGELSAKECPIPVCAADPDELMTRALEQRGWSQMPQCGGRLGVEVETPLIGLVGVVKVDAVGRLDKAGVRDGDMIAYVEEERVKSPESLDSLLHRYAEQEVEVSFVRDEKIWKGRMTIPKNVESLRYRASKEYRVTHRWGARVMAVAPDGALADETVIGRDITHVDGVEVEHAEHLRELIRYRTPGETLRLSYRTPRTLETDESEVKLAIREDPWGL